MTDSDSKNEQFWTDFIQTGNITSYLRYKGLSPDITDKNVEEEYPIGSYGYRGNNNERN